jgi:hypothetical protein
VEELAKVTVTNIRIALARHQSFKRPLPIAHRIAMEPKRLGYETEFALRLAEAGITRTSHIVIEASRVCCSQPYCKHLNSRASQKREAFCV